MERTRKKIEEANENISTRRGWHPVDADLSYVGPIDLSVTVERMLKFSRSEANFQHARKSAQLTARASHVRAHA